jgi:hypothetical protein
MSCYGINEMRAGMMRGPQQLANISRGASPMSMMSRATMKPTMKPKKKYQFPMWLGVIILIFVIILIIYMTKMY